MPHVADHQFVALFKLAALNSAGQKVADRSQKRNVLRIKSSFLAGTDAEDAIGPAVAAGDAHGHAALAVVIRQIAWHLESRLGVEIVDDSRSRRVKGEASKTIRRGCG